VIEFYLNGYIKPITDAPNDVGVCYYKYWFIFEVYSDPKVAPNELLLLILSP
jgi:hypothetical protein